MICGVIVAFNPERESFIALLDRLYPQVQHLVVVDNSEWYSNVVLELCLETGLDLDRFSLIRLGKNRGIAAALNVGIEEALRLSAAFVLLSDQDSLPAEDMVFNLLQAYKALESKGVQVGAVGPTFTDLHTKKTYPFQTKINGRVFYSHKSPVDGEPHVEALTLITSGTLIPVSAILDVGLMREDFFIDQVDIEWCHRARSKRYRLFGTGLARMYQRMGEDRLRVWYLRWRYESAYSPERIYYRWRNFVALWKLDYIDWRWKLRSSWYLLGVLYTHSVYGAQRLTTLRMFATGVWHGIRGRMGRSNY